MERSSKVLVQEEDRLSSLPDPIICHILSFMPTKYAAKASILSRRWRPLFLDVSILLFDEKEGISHSQDQAFSDFVNRRFMLCKTHSPISEFRLKLPFLPRICQVNSWVAALLKHNVKLIDIEENPEAEYTPDPRYLPRDLFMSASLVVLKLCGVDIVLKLPELVQLPNLKVLHLKDLECQYASIYFRFDDRRFPLLEYLSLQKVRFRCREDENFFGLRIFSPTLKFLEIFVDDNPVIMAIDVDTPCLLHFDYEAFSQVKLCFSENEHLKKMCLYDHFNAGHDGFHSRLLRMAHNLEDLALTGFSTSDLGYPLPQFPNLTYLSLYYSVYESMWSMLQNAPKLEDLKYRMCDDNVHFVPPNDVPLCLAQSLKQIRLQNFAASSVGYIERDIEFVKYALQHGAMLEKVTLEQPKDVGRKVFTELLKLPRCSAECVIQLELKYDME